MSALCSEVCQQLGPQHYRSTGVHSTRARCVSDMCGVGSKGMIVVLYISHVLCPYARKSVLDFQLRGLVCERTEIDFGFRVRFFWHALNHSGATPDDW
jgi:hypothetical protein